MRPFWHWRRRDHELAAELDDELTLHLELRAEELVRAGLSPDALIALLESPSRVA